MRNLITRVEWKLISCDCMVCYEYDVGCLSCCLALLCSLPSHPTIPSFCQGMTHVVGHRPPEGKNFTAEHAIRLGLSGRTCTTIADKMKHIRRTLSLVRGAFDLKITSSSIPPFKKHSKK